MAIEATGPNAEQIKYWNEVSGPKWVTLSDFIDGQIEPLGALAMDRAAIRSGERILDVGCGCGPTTLALARRVGPDGRVTGIDISRVMLERAAENARAAGAGNVRFANADAQTHTFEADYDLVYSRFGVMFFADPVAAFTNLRLALRPGGRLVFICWQSLMLNEWMLTPVMAAAQHVPLPPPPAPDAPGPFAFADPERVRGIVTGAGFTEVAVEDVQTTMTIGAGYDLDQVVDIMLQLGPAGQALREADPEVLPRVAASVREAMLPYQTPEGVRMKCAAWVVTARHSEA